jgi:predicted metal-dependent hydrolase
MPSPALDPDELPLDVSRHDTERSKSGKASGPADKASALGLNSRAVLKGPLNSNLRRTQGGWPFWLALVLLNAALFCAGFMFLYRFLGEKIYSAHEMDTGESWQNSLAEVKKSFQSELQAAVAKTSQIQVDLQTELKKAKERADIADARLEAYEEQSKLLLARLRDVAASTQKGEGGAIKAMPISAEAIPGSIALPENSMTPTQSELVLLKERNRLTSLADEAISTAAREPYDELWKAFDDPRMVHLIHGARAEILRVQQHYLAGSRLAKYDIPVAEVFPDTPNLKDTQLSDDQLISIVTNPRHIWQNRVKASWLLGQRKTTKAAEALIKVVKEDTNLDVVKEATFSFEQMTGYHATLFEPKPLEAWWKEFNALPAIKKPSIPVGNAKTSSAKSDPKPVAAGKKEGAGEKAP